MTTACPICGVPSAERITDRIKGNEPISVWRCRPCALDYLEIWDDVERVKSFYEGDRYLFSVNSSDATPFALKFDEYEEYYRRVKPHLSPQMSVLEIGCGDGSFMRRIREDVAVVEGLELSPPQVARLRSEGFVCHDVMLEDLQGDRTYDTICLFALLEHVPNVQTFLQALKRRLAPGGQVFLEVPNLHDPLMSAYDVPAFRTFYYRPIHLYYFTPASLRAVLATAGFVCDIETMQQASLTNHFHWAYRQEGQPTANHMTSAVPPTTLRTGEHTDGAVLAGVLDRVDDFYRQLLQERQMGDLLFARATLDS